MWKCGFNEVAKQLSWNHKSTWVLSFKFAAYFQNIFLQERLWGTAFNLPELIHFAPMFPSILVIPSNP